MTQSTQEQNKALVLEAFDLLFNKRDYVTAERYWSPHDYSGAGPEAQTTHEFRWLVIADCLHLVLLDFKGAYSGQAKGSTIR